MGFFCVERSNYVVKNKRLFLDDKDKGLITSDTIFYEEDKVESEFKRR